MAPKFALFTKGSKLPLNKSFKNMFELPLSCAQPSICENQMVKGTQTLNTNFDLCILKINVYVSLRKMNNYLYEVASYIGTAVKVIAVMYAYGAETGI